MDEDDEDEEDDARNAPAAGHINVNNDIASGVAPWSGLVNNDADAAAAAHNNNDDNDDEKLDDARNTAAAAAAAAAAHNNAHTDIVSGVAQGSGLIYPEHHGLLDEDDDEEEEEEEEDPMDEVASAKSSKPKLPDTSQMSPTEAKAAMKQYRKEYKKIYDKQRLQSIKSAAASNHSSSPQKSQNYTGDQTPSIRHQMVVVETKPLLVGHSFQCKETLQIRAAEEANLRMIKVTVDTSDSMNYSVMGHDFCVSATCGIRHGWVVKVAVCREGDDTGKIPSKLRVFDASSLRNPFRGDWVGHLIRSAVEQTPRTSFKQMQHTLQ